MLHMQTQSHSLAHRHTYGYIESLRLDTVRKGNSVVGFHVPKPAHDASKAVLRGDVSKGYPRSAGVIASHGEAAKTSEELRGLNTSVTS